MAVVCRLGRLVSHKTLILQRSMCVGRHIRHLHPQPIVFKQCRNKQQQLNGLNCTAPRNFHCMTSYCCQKTTDGITGEGANSKPVKVDYTLQEAVLDVMDAKYRISYVDEGDKSKPVVVCLHGMPACHKDFLAITPKLLKGGTRVIIPNFPGRTVLLMMRYYSHLSVAYFHPWI